jgi:hypothetical protein
MFADVTRKIKLIMGHRSTTMIMTKMKKQFPEGPWRFWGPGPVDSIIPPTPSPTHSQQQAHQKRLRASYQSTSKNLSQLHCCTKHTIT